VQKGVQLLFVRESGREGVQEVLGGHVGSGGAFFLGKERDK